MRPATMTYKHISALNPAAEKWKTVISHTEHLFFPWPILQIKVKCLNNSVSPAQTHRCIDVSYRHKLSTWNGNCKWDVFPSKTGFWKPKSVKQSLFFLSIRNWLECKFAVDCGGLHPSWHTVGAQWLKCMQPSWHYYIQMKDYEKQTFVFIWNNANSVL